MDVPTQGEAERENGQQAAVRPGTYTFPIQVLWVLVLGFGTTILLLLAAGYGGISAMESIESSATRLVEEQRAVTLLIDRIQRLEADLTSLFFELASETGQADRKALQQRLLTLEKQLEVVTREGTTTTRERKEWIKAREAARAFAREMQALLVQPSSVPPPQSLFRRHDQFLDEIGGLVAADYADSAVQETSIIQRSSERISRSFKLLWAAVAFSIVGAVVTTAVASSLFRRLEWQRAELADLSRHTIERQETAARRFSRELHDDFGQTLSAIEANLVALPHSTDREARLRDCMVLVKDAISKARQLSQLLRPSILDDFGLNAGLTWLAEGFEQRTGVKVDFDSSFNGRLPDETETQFFRIAQEALTNVARHSGATKVQIELIGGEREVSLRVSDNGKGLEPNRLRTGMGMVGMRARARSAGGDLVTASKAGKGVEIRVTVPYQG